MSLEHILGQESKDVKKKKERMELTQETLKPTEHAKAGRTWAKINNVAKYYNTKDKINTHESMST